jgi:hypothetical protein
MPKVTATKNLRREDDGLADQLALGVLGNIDRVGTGAGGAANECVLVCCRPATMADVAAGDLLGVCVCGIAGNHTETLCRHVSKQGGFQNFFSFCDGFKGGKGKHTGLKAVVLPLGI